MRQSPLPRALVIMRPLWRRSLTSVFAGPRHHGSCLPQWSPFLRHLSLVWDWSLRGTYGSRSPLFPSRLLRPLNKSWSISHPGRSGSSSRPWLGWWLCFPDRVRLFWSSLQEATRGLITAARDWQGRRNDHFHFLSISISFSLHHPLYTTECAQSIFRSTV